MWKMDHFRCFAYWSLGEGKQIKGEHNLIMYVSFRVP